VCEQERLRHSAMTAGKQLKRMVPLRAKALSSTGNRPAGGPETPPPAKANSGGGAGDQDGR
jgi:hypothetical protein